MTEPLIADVPSPRSRPVRWLARIFAVVAGLAVGAGVAELVFAHRDGGAFPHLNIYVADTTLGVRLQPGATEAISFGGNPITHVVINDDGYRGASLPPPSRDEILVVGDSQVFGLGVEEPETFARQLATLTRRPVVNGGVPTYGPAEYRAVIAEQLARRHPSTVVLTLNLVNDLFEARHPNRERHAVWDGWAVRKETAPATTTWFPGRDWLFRRSHLMFALRKWQHGDARDTERGVASEGTWRELVLSGEELTRQRAALSAKGRARGEAVASAHSALASAETDVDRAIYEHLRDVVDIDYNAIAVARVSPGDIVFDEIGEGARAIIATAGHVAEAAASRARLRKELARWAQQHRGAGAKQALAALAERDRARAQLAELDVARLEAALEPPLAGYLREVQQLVEGAGARLVVVILPIDVQVSAEEWKKYGIAGMDMAPSLALTAELVGAARDLGLSVLDATPVLAAVEPGAFLDKDIHMTPKGHAAVAQALAKTLAEPAPRRAVASKRSPVPLPDVFQDAPEIIVTGSSAAGCETKQVREWLRVQCPRTETASPVDLQVTQDDSREAMALVLPSELSLVAPIVEGQTLTATFAWTDATRVLRLAWPAGAAKPTLAFDRPVKRAAKPTGDNEFRSAAARAICGCWHRLYNAVKSPFQRGLSCAGAYGAPDQACVDTYDEDAMCPDLLACVRRDPASPPRGAAR